VNPNIYLHEIIRTVPGREEPYMASVASLHHDPTRDHRMDSGAVQQFRTVPASGPWPGVINIWEKTWAGQTVDLVGQFLDTKRDSAMEDGWNRNLHLRRGGYDRLLIPTEYSPTIAELSARGVTGEVFWHEITWVPFGEPRRYLDRLGEQLLPALPEFGLDLIGAYRVAMRPRQVLTVVGAREWSQFGALLAATRTHPRLEQWTDYRAATVDHADELLLIPARHGTLYPGP
jgi:hypothetical protein